MARTVAEIRAAYREAVAVYDRNFQTRDGSIEAIIALRTSAADMKRLRGELDDANRREAGNG